MIKYEYTNILIITFRLRYEISDVRKSIQS